MATPPKKPPETQLIPGAIELDAQMQMRLEEEARKELQAEQMALAQKAFKAAAKRRLQTEMAAAAGVKEDELVPIFIELAPYTDCIKIDGIEYSHGRTYNFAPEVVPTILEIIHRTWRHEEEISEAKNRNAAFRRKNPMVVRPGVH